MKCKACEALKHTRYGCSPNQNWEVTSVSAGRPGMLYITLWNHCTGDENHWGMYDTQVLDWTADRAFNWAAITGASSGYPKGSV
jgi:hypothetical protein